MNLRESYDYMLITLSSIYKETHDNELGGVLGGLDTSLYGRPFDPASWEDWQDSVHKVTSNENLTEEEADQAIIALLNEYYTHHGIMLKRVIKFFRKRKNI